MVEEFGNDLNRNRFCFKSEVPQLEGNDDCGVAIQNMDTYCQCVLQNSNNCEEYVEIDIKHENEDCFSTAENNNNEKHQADENKENLCGMDSTDKKSTSYNIIK